MNHPRYLYLKLKVHFDYEKTWDANGTIQEPNKPEFIYVCPPY